MLLPERFQSLQAQAGEQPKIGETGAVHAEFAQLHPLQGCEIHEVDTRHEKDFDRRAGEGVRDP